MISARYQLGDLEGAVEATVSDLDSDGVARRLFDRDFTLFGAEPTEIANRMGWFDAPRESLDRWSDLVELGEALIGEVTDLVVMGMGGSSLFPEVLARHFNGDGRHPRLRVLDSTDPGAIGRVLDETDPASTMHIAASKSGTTLETRSHLDLFWERSGDPGRFAVITDAGSELGDLARERGFRWVFENDPDIGGRFAALSLFGMVPAAFCGADGAAMLEAGLDMLEVLEPRDDDATAGVGLWLGATVAEAALSGREQLTIVVDPSVASFGLWLEQLVAESTGKHGKGVIPVVGEPVDAIVANPERRLIVTIGDVDAPALRRCGAPMVELSLEEPTDLGAHVVLWEFAISVVGRVLGINPFDQPDVEAAKQAARDLLGGAAVADPAEATPEEVFGSIGDDDTVAVCAFVDPDGLLGAEAQAFRARIAARTGATTTLGYGPRFLHSTGQLHKGGPSRIVVVQFEGTDVGVPDVAIPGRPFTFGELKRAQAAGDLLALKASGHRAFRLPVATLGDPAVR
ncbi:MAG: hypothetical protein R2698_05615 [Microthrixaceae bacterium]